MKSFLIENSSGSTLAITETQPKEGGSLQHRSFRGDEVALTIRPEICPFSGILIKTNHKYNKNFSPFSQHQDVRLELCFLDSGAAHCISLNGSAGEFTGSDDVDQAERVRFGKDENTNKYRKKHWNKKKVQNGPFEVGSKRGLDGGLAQLANIAKVEARQPTSPQPLAAIVNSAKAEPVKIVVKPHVVATKQINRKPVKLVVQQHIVKALDQFLTDRLDFVGPYRPDYFIFNNIVYLYESVVVDTKMVSLSKEVRDLYVWTDPVNYTKTRWDITEYETHGYYSIKYNTQRFTTHSTIMLNDVVGRISANVLYDDYVVPLLYKSSQNRRTFLSWMGAFISVHSGYRKLWMMWNAINAKCNVLNEVQLGEKTRHQKRFGNVDSMPDFENWVSGQGYNALRVVRISSQLHDLLDNSVYAGSIPDSNLLNNLIFYCTIQTEGVDIVNPFLAAYDIDVGSGIVSRHGETRNKQDLITNTCMYWFQQLLKRYTYKLSIGFVKPKIAKL